MESNVIRGPWDERWISIPGYHRYSISNWGNVFDTLKEEFLESRVDSTGHVRVDLLNGASSWSVYVYVLVAQLFLPNYSASLRTKHRDRDVTNNRIDNLYQEKGGPKLVHVIDEPKSTRPAKPNPKPGKPRKVVIVEANRVFSSVKSVADRLGVSESAIYRVLDDPTAKCQGLTIETYYGEDKYV